MILQIIFAMRSGEVILSTPERRIRPHAGMRPERRLRCRDSGRRVSIPARLPIQESWPKSD